MNFRFQFPSVWIVSSLVLTCLGSSITARGQGSFAAEDPLPSWNECPAKAVLLDFVKKTTVNDSIEFVPPEDRIAVFDNDGTLWPENPVPFEVAFALDTARIMMASHPELKTRPAFKALEGNDLDALTNDHYKLLFELIAATHAGETTDEFARSVVSWIATARHPRYERRYLECTYLPMQHVLRFLRANGFKTYLVSGGGQDFMRIWAQDVYGIPPEQVIGSVFKTKYELIEEKPILRILPEVALLNDKAGKPTAIHTFIGKKPILCFGNSDGDLEMLQLTTIGRKPSLGLIIHHTDAEREYSYDAQPKSSGKLVEALAAAGARGWVVVDMKHDWKEVFADGK